MPYHSNMHLYIELIAYLILIYCARTCVQLRHECHQTVNSAARDYFSNVPNHLHAIQFVCFVVFPIIAITRLGILIRSMHGFLAHKKIILA
jgi:hypothetical protein